MQSFGPDITLGKDVFVHPSAQMYGQVTLAEGVSLWPNAVIRAEMFEVTVGATPTSRTSP